MRVRTEAKRSDIVDIAATVFLEQGFARASMSEIAARLGGSKTTLYGYFRSKEELFVEVVVAEALKELLPAFEEIDENAADLRDALVPVGEKLVTFLLTPDAIAAHRMVMSEAGRSNIGQLYYSNGRQRGLGYLAAFLERASKIGKIRPCDFTIAATLPANGGAGDTLSLATSSSTEFGDSTTASNGTPILSLALEPSPSEIAFTNSGQSISTTVTSPSKLGGGTYTMELRENNQIIETITQITPTQNAITFNIYPISGTLDLSEYVAIIYKN